VAATYTTDPIRVIDSDSHITEPPGLWVDHAPAKFRERVPHVVEDEPGRPHWVVDGKDFGPMGYTWIAPDGSKITGGTNDMEQSLEGVHKGAYDVKARLGWLDEHGIYQQVMFPNTVAGIGGARVLTEVADNELRTACVSIYNDAMAEMQRESGQRILPLAQVPFWDIDLAVKEVKRAFTELGLRGITMCDNPHALGYPSPATPEWDPFWSQCEDLSMAVAFHIGSGLGGGGARVPPWVEGRRGEIRAIQVATSYLGNAPFVSNLIFSGILLRHPRLKVFSSETGIGWMPSLMESMDFHWHEALTPEAKREWQGLLPSDLCRRNLYFSYWFEHWRVDETIDFLGGDNVMFETDFPHANALSPRVTEHVAKTLASLRPEVRRKVLHDNAARLFSLPAAVPVSA
jgi:predicted TIM-barrel fold metal-dependent hydrolase